MFWLSLPHSMRLGKLSNSSRKDTKPPHGGFFYGIPKEAGENCIEGSVKDISDMKKELRKVSRLFPEEKRNKNNAGGLKRIIHGPLQKAPKLLFLGNLHIILLKCRSVSTYNNIALIEGVRRA